ncbi:hypothetical protein [Magnetospirillum sp. SS-4]|uniref:hypothetical protein n=1 Tax=Magnetospirillum sp. SS-4 TaxID=2681465 RepID=UPI001383AA96|nr:hypothetical protein [Magnetospirillum sp. SS-4]CAA7615901.1 conserved exported hypothetical protein [Magnetospirillum sp. SS-4]
MNQTISLAPLVSWPWLAALAVAATLVAGLGLALGARGGGWRALVLGVLVLALANPRLVSERRTPLPDTALVVVDQTLSQEVDGRAGQAETALAEVQERLGRLAGLDVRVERVSGTPGQDEGTRLFAAVDRALAEVPRRRLAGVVMITDGRVHDVPADRGRSLDAPVHVLLTGRPGERDRRLVPGKSPGFGLVGRDAALSFRVEDQGGEGDATVTVRLDGQPHATISVPLNRDATIEIPIRHAGQNVVELEVEPGPGEMSPANNAAALVLSGVRDRLKVLLVSGEPHAGGRAWRNLLKADPAVDLVHFTILRPPEKDDRTPIHELSLIAFPVRELFEEKLYDFDLVIFDRYRRRGVLSAGYYRNLAEYVRRGGALLAAVGPEFAEAGGMGESALTEVLPARPAGTLTEHPFPPRLTEAGRRHPVTSGLAGSRPGDAPWGRWMRQVDTAPPRGLSVMTGAGDRPLVVLDRVGDGRVAMVLSDSIWLWAKGWDGGGPHDELLRRLAHWLMKEPDLEERSLRAEVAAGSLSVIRRSLDSGDAEVTVTGPDGVGRPLTLHDRGDGSAAGAMPVSRSGLWRVEDDGGLAAIAAAGPASPVEMAELTADSGALAPVAEASRGGLAWLSQGGVPGFRRISAGGAAAGRGWMGLVDKGDYQVDGVRDIPLLPAWALLLLGLGGLLAAWRREGRE